MPPKKGKGAKTAPAKTSPTPPSTESTPAVTVSSGGQSPTRGGRGGRGRKTQQQRRQAPDASASASQQSVFEEEMRLFREQNGATSEEPESSASQPAPSALISPSTAWVTDTGSTDTQSQSSITVESILGSMLEGAPIERADTLVLAMKDNVDSGVCVLLNLLFVASGVRDAELAVSAVRDESSITGMLEELNARVPENSDAYLLVNKDAKFKRFGASLAKFCQRVVEQSYSVDLLLELQSTASQSSRAAGNIIRVDGYFPILVQWLVSMSESKARSFRHTATVVLLSVIDGLNSLTSQVKERMACTKLKRELNALQQHSQALGELRDDIFSRAIHQRVRDVCSEIRLAVVQSLKVWITEQPDVFIANKYLRYFSLPLHDKRAESRAQALETILHVMSMLPDYVTHMQDFLRYFMTRITEMCWDVDTRCAELAIRVAAFVVHLDSEAAEGQGLLENSAIDRILSTTLFDERAVIRASAGILLLVLIHCQSPLNDDGEAASAAETELLCAFATTFRAQYHERTPERYLVDAVWPSDAPPRILSEYAPILKQLQRGTCEQAAVALELVSAMLLKGDGKLCIGPPVKDDRKVASSASGGAANARRNGRQGAGEGVALAEKLSSDVLPLLSSALAKYRGEEVILRGVASVVAAINLTAATKTPSKAANLSALMVDLRKAASTLPILRDRECLVQLTSAWTALVTSEYPQRSEAETHFKELEKDVIRQLKEIQRKEREGDERESERGSTSDVGGKRDKDIQQQIRVWGRMTLVASLTSLSQHWPILHSSLLRCIDRYGSQVVVDPALAQLVRFMTEATVQTLFWQLKDAHAEDAAAEQSQALRARIGDIVECLIKILGFSVSLPESQEDTDVSIESESNGSDASGSSARRATVPSGVKLVTGALVTLCDLASLPYYALSREKEDLLFRAFAGICDHLDVLLAEATQKHKDAVKEDAENHTNVTQVAFARRRVSRVEALEMRTCTGIARLMLFKRISDDATPRFLVRWTRTSSKTVADVFKSVFHAVRDRSIDGAAVEMGMLLAAYEHCVAAGATAESIDALGQVGAKLALVHFSGNDRFYNVCVRVVQHGIEHAATTDPLILHGVVPYCAKLRQLDAIRTVRSLESNAFFSSAAASTNPYVRAFVAALRRAGKLDVAIGAAAGVTRPSASRSVKRPREMTGAPADEEAAQVDTLLADIARAADPMGSQHRGTTPGADGWRRRPTESSGSPDHKGNIEDGDEDETFSNVSMTPLPSQQTEQQGDGYPVSAHPFSSTAPQGRQRTSSPMLVSADLTREEKFIATEDFE